MSDFQVKKITLPGGKVVELVYFAGDEPPCIDALAVPVEQQLELCPVCRGELVSPVAWEEVDDARWHVELRCPDCEWRGINIFDQETVDRYDDVLCAATDDLISLLERLTRENMEADIARFTAALDAGHILPMDF